MFVEEKRQVHPVAIVRGRRIRLTEGQCGKREWMIDDKEDWMGG